MVVNNYRYFNILDSVSFRLICGTNFANVYRCQKFVAFSEFILSQGTRIS
jgi:hypothetical protein